MQDQADELRQLVRQRAHSATAEPAPPPRLIAVASGKGGVGTTTVAVNLAVALALAGRRVVLVDMNFDGPHAAALARVDARYNVADVFSGRRSLHEVLERGPVGIQIAAGPWGRDAALDCSPAAQQRLFDELRALGPHAELVLLDVGAGLNRVTRGFWQAADDVLAVLTPEPIALINTYAAIKLLAADREAPLQVLVNRTEDAAAAAPIVERIARACRRFLRLRVEQAGWLPEDAAVDTAAQACQPFRLQSPECAAAHAIDRLAERWASELERRLKTATGRGVGPLCIASST